MRRLAVLGIVLLLVVPVVFGYVYLKPEDIKFREGGPERYNPYFYDPRVQTFKIDTWVYLVPPEPPIFATGQPAIYQRGTARIESMRSPYYPRGSVHLKVKDLRPTDNDNSYYQAWLLDSDSGQYLNLGLFEAIGGGVGELEFESTHYYDPYDMVVVTREPKGDTDPSPSSDVALIGSIVKQGYYVPPELATKKMYGYTYERQ